MKRGRKYVKRLRAKRRYARRNTGRRYARRRRRNPILGVHHPAYTTRSTKIRGMSGKQSVYSVMSSQDAARILKKTLHTWTKQQHRHAAEDAAKKAKQVESAYSRALDAAAMETWGRKFQPFDYRISAIGSDEFSEKRKTQLRNLAHSMSRLKDLQRAHAWAGRGS